MKELLKTLCNLDGVSGYEEAVAAAITEMVKPHADEIITDSLGNLIVFKKGKKARKRPAMLCAHMDEVGFLVKKITEDGMLKLAPVGGIDPRVLIGRRMRVGPKGVKGIISIKAIHLTTPEERKTAPPLKSLYIDIGAKSKGEAEAAVSVGDAAAFDSEFYDIGDCVKGKALDDRIGCAVMIKLLQGELAYDTYFAFVVGEEVGLLGSKVAANRIGPAAALVLEGTSAADLPDVPAHKQVVSQRKGPAVSLIDGATVYNRDFRNKMTAAADKKGIKWQYRKSANGGTDAGSIHTALDGCLVLGLSAPTRYIHCANGMVYLPDVEEMVRFGQVFIEEAGELDV